MMIKAITREVTKKMTGVTLASRLSNSRPHCRLEASAFTTSASSAISGIPGTSTPRVDVSCFMAATFAACAAHATIQYSQAEEQKVEERWTGVSENDIDDFVNLMLADESINMSAIPDSIERVIYKSAVSITLEAIYEALGALDGVEIFNHELQLMQRERDDNSVDHSWIVSQYMGVDDEILEQVADRLLANQSINQTLVPDVVERQLYVNVLRLVFRLLDTIAASFVITLCGHDLRLQFAPSAEAASRVSAEPAFSQVSLDSLRAYARNGVGGMEASQKSGIYGEMMIQLNTSLYGLILGILDDLLANTEIDILSDRIGIDIVPIKSKPLWKRAVTAIPASPKTAAKKSNGTGYIRTLTTFGLGIGVGVVGMVLASHGI